MTTLAAGRARIFCYLGVSFGADVEREIRFFVAVFLVLSRSLLLEGAAKVC